MTKITKKPAAPKPLPVEWVEEAGFEVRLEASAVPEWRPLPPQSSSDTGFLSAPPGRF